MSVVIFAINIFLMLCFILFGCILESFKVGKES